MKSLKNRLINLISQKIKNTLQRVNPTKTPCAPGKEETNTPLAALSDERINSMLEQAFLDDWIDGQDVMSRLHISPRTLQTLRSNGTLPYSRINNKIYYLRQDVERILRNNYIMFKIKH